MHRLAIYDMDKTVTLAPTWTGFLLATARARAPWRLALLPAAALATLGYGLKLYDRARLKQITQRLLLGHRLTQADADAAAATFADRVAAGGIFAGARDRLAADKAAGYRLVMATASYRFYAAAIADRLGFDDAIGTQTRLDKAGNLLSRIEGENCYGAVKLAMIQVWMEREGIAREDAHVRFYSDHVSDAPALAWADEAYAVHPHPPLRALAAEKGWQVLDWAR
jgi:HAD superfamily hydrolase (TIGR01490 family)